MRIDITSFVQGNDESLYEAWERYTELLRNCPHNGLPFWRQVQTFYNGLLPNIQTMVDVAAGGALNNKTPEDAYELLELMANNNYQRPNERAMPKRTMGLHEVDAFDTLSAQIAPCQSQLGGMNVNSFHSPFITCEFCAGNHESVECQDGNQLFFSTTEQVNYIVSSQRLQNDPFANTYNLGWENNPNLSWSDQSSQSNQRTMPNHQPVVNHQPCEQRMSKLEDIFEEFMQETTSFMNETHSNFINQGVSIQNLEVQMGQLVEQLTERSQGSLPSTTVTNPEEQLNVIPLRRGIVLEQPHNEEKLEEHEDKTNEEENLKAERCAKYLGEFQPSNSPHKEQFEEFGVNAHKSKLVLEETPNIGLNQSPSHLKYAYTNLKFRKDAYENVRNPKERSRGGNGK